MGRISPHGSIRSGAVHGDRRCVRRCGASNVMAAPGTSNAVGRDSTRGADMCARRCRANRADTIDPIGDTWTFDSLRRNRQQKHQGAECDSLTAAALGTLRNER